MKQHKDIREILKRSGTAPTGICGFWRSAASFAAVLFGAFAGVQISRRASISVRAVFWVSASRYGSCGGVGHRASRPFPRGCPRAVSSAAVLLTFNTLQLWEKSHCYSQERVTTPTYKACGRIRSSFSTALTTCVAHGRGRNRTHTIPVINYR